MKLLVAVTDNDWYRFLYQRHHVLDEANFWQPSGSTGFRAIDQGEPLLFKLHAPQHFIVGGGFFAHFSRLPYRTAWDFFGEANGAASLPEMRARIEKYRRTPSDPGADYEIGCIMLAGTFFFDEADWIEPPASFARNIVRYKGYDHGETEGARLWEQVQERLRRLEVADARPVTEDADLYGDPVLVRRRLGQGSFRAVVSDTYSWRCAVSGERAHPVLEAAHILPVSEGGEHDVRNGLLLRSDIHRLFDRGYVTVTRKHEFRVSSRLKKDFDNGEIYYPLDHRQVHVPECKVLQPDREFLEWHGDVVFRP